MLLWLIFVTVMTGFLTAAATLWFSTAQLSETLNKSHTAIAVRSDPGIVVYPRKKNTVWEVDLRKFTAEDAKTVSALDGVKSVRSHTLSGGSSPAFLPVAEIRREFSWRANGDISPYYNAVFAGRLVKKSKDIMRTEYYRTYADGQEGNDLFLLFKLEDVLLLNSEFDEPIINLKFNGGFSYAIDVSEDPDAASYFVEGEQYIVSGTFEPLVRTTSWGISLNSEQSEWSYSMYFVIEGGRIKQRDGYLESVSGRDVPWSYGTKEESADTVFPAIERWDGDPQAFFEKTPHDAWREFRDAWEIQSHAVPVIGTDRLETVFSFLTGDAAMLEGRSFTEEECQSGARVMVISEKMAARAGLKIGDTVPFIQFPGSDRAEESVSAGYSLNNPVADMLKMNRTYTDAEPFEIVGIYRLQAEWSQETYAFTPNTVFIPRSAQITGGFGTIRQEEPQAPQEPDGRSDVYGMYLSVELENGSVEEFQLALEQSPYAGQFYVYDQGFEAVQRDINGLAVSTARLLWIAIGGWVLLLILYLLMYQSPQRKNIGIMRSLGTPPAKTRAYLAVSGLIVALAGIVIGTALSRIALNVVQERVLSDMLGMIDRTSSGGTVVITDESLTEMVQNSVPPLKTTLLIALSELGVMCAAIWIHAAVLSRMAPRKLSEG